MGPVHLRAIFPVKIENTSWKVLTYGIYTRVVFVSEIERVSEERGGFLLQKQRAGKYRTKHFTCGIVFIVYILRHSSFWWPFCFKSFQNA